MQNKKNFKTSIGGQAVIEGVMMKGVSQSAMAVRTPGGEIDVEIWDNPKPKWYKKVPIVRGVINFVVMLIEGYKTLMKSAEKAGFDEAESESKFDQWLTRVFGEKLMGVISVVALILGVALALLLFMVIPAFLTRFLRPVIGSQIALSAIEGVIKIAIFVAYLALVSRMEDIRRVFEYHGAEHKTIFCYEHGQEMTVENVLKEKRFHPRCGTSFLLIVLVLSILVFSVVTWDSLVLRVVLKFAFLPLVVGVAYEIIKFAGRHDNPFTRAISAPGLWLQRLTTAEPDASQVEVALASFLPVMPKDENEDDRW